MFLPGLVIHMVPQQRSSALETDSFGNWKNRLRRAMLRRRQDQHPNGGEENEVKNHTKRIPEQRKEREDK